MADSKRQIILDLLARNKMGSETREAADELDKLGRSAEDADSKTEKLGETTEKASKKTDKLGNSVDETKGRISKLESEILDSEKELGKLSTAFADTDDAASRIDLSKGIRKSQANIRSLTKNKSILEDLLPKNPEQDVEKWTQKFGNSLKSSVESLPSIGQAGAVIGALLAPEIGGLVSAAIVGGVGLGGIIGGVALAASSNGEIKSAGSKLGKSFVSSLQAEAKDALSGPILVSLQHLQAGSAKIVQDIGKVFQAVAPEIVPLTDDLIKFADVLSGSIANAAGKSGPVIASLGKLFADTGQSLAGLINAAAQSSQGGASALDDLDTALQGTIKTFTFAIQTLSDFKGSMDQLDDKIDKGRAFLEDHIGWLDATADGYKKGSEAAKLYREGIIGVNGASNDYSHYAADVAAAADNVANSHRSAAEAAAEQKKAEQTLAAEMKAETDPAFALLKAINDVRDAKKEETAATKKYGAQSEQARSATDKLAQAAIALSGAAADAGGTFNGKLSGSLRATLKQAGLTKSQIAAVASELARAKRAADSYSGSYTATFYAKFVGNGYATAQEAQRDMGRRASGGPVLRGVPYLVGENGPEVIVPSAAGNVINASATRGLMAEATVKGMTGTMAAMSQGGGGYGGVLTVSGDADSKVASLINYLIRIGKVTIA